MLITSVQNPRVKEAAKLRERKHRAESGRIVIDGAREIARAIQAGVAIPEIFVCEELCHTDEAVQLLKTLPSLPNTETLQVTPAVFEKLAFGERAEGVLAVAEMP